MFKRRLVLEGLEDRRMMSSGTFVSLLGGAIPSRIGEDAVAAVSGPAPGMFLGLPDLYEPDNSAASAKPIATDGRSQRHTMHQPSDQDWVRFTLAERSNVSIVTRGRAGNTELTVFGPGDPSSAIASSDGNGGFARLDLRGASALEAGVYYVRVREYQQDARIGSYQLSVKATPAPLPDGFEADDAPALARPIEVNGGPQARSIHAPNDVDWAVFQLQAAADVVIETRGVSGDTRLWLYGADPNAAPIEFDNNDGVGSFSVIVRAGARALPAGVYYVKVDEAGQNAVIGHYTLSVTALQLGDILLTQGKDGLAKGIRLGESVELGVAFADTFSHAAIYVGGGQVAEMLTSGFAVTPLAKRYAESQRVDILRDRGVDEQVGAAVVEAAMKYAGTPYGFAQISVFAAAALAPGQPHKVEHSVAYAAYKSRSAGTQRMICSELVAVAYDEALVPIEVTLWPTLAPISGEKEFRMDFTSPTMLALSPDLTRLNA